MADMTTPITQLPNLPPQNINKLTYPASQLTKGELIAIGKEIYQGDKVLNLTLRDIQSLRECFSNYGVSVGGGAVGGGAACCSSIVCCCCASAVTRPARVTRSN